MAFVVEKDFPKTWPFGILKTLLWLVSLFLIITIFLSPFTYGGTSFVLFCAWTTFIMGLLSWIAHLLGLQRQSFNSGSFMLYIPFTFMDFVLGSLFFLFYGISALICFISIITSFNYALVLVVCYLFATGFCLLNMVVCGYLALLLYRGAPNGLILNLRAMIIEGDRLVMLNLDTAQQNVPVPPMTYPHGTNPV